MLHPIVNALLTQSTIKFMGTKFLPAAVLILSGLMTSSVLAQDVPTYRAASAKPVTRTEIENFVLPPEIQAQLQARGELVSAEVDPLASETVLFTEGFESGLGAWTTGSQGSAGCTWTTTSSGSPPEGTKAAAPCTGIPGASYPAKMGSYMFYGPFSLAGAVTAEMRFKLAIELQTGDVLWVLSSAGCGTFNGGGYSNGSMQWQDAVLDLTPLAGENSVCVFFQMSTDATSNTGGGVLLDAIEIIESDGVTTADLSLNLIDVPNGSYTQGDNIAILSGIENIGAETSSAYSITYYASTDTTITDADTSMGTCSGLPAIDAGGDFFFNCGTSIPGGLSNGDYYIGGILSVVDADAGNHVAHDPDSILVSDAPGIEVRPMEVTIREPASGAVPTDIEKQNADLKAEQYMQNIAPALFDTIDRRGFVNIIVGLQQDFLPEGFMNLNDQLMQRQSISDNSSQLISELKGLNAVIGHQYQTIPYVSMQVDSNALRYLLLSPMVRSIEEDKLARPYMESSNQVIGSPAAWAEGFDGNGWAVAILDTGVDKTHPYFTTGGNKVVSEACYNRDVDGIVEPVCPGGVTVSTADGSGVNCTGVSFCDHGTHVAGTVAGHNGSGPNFGVARGADIIAMQVFSKFLTEDDCGVGEAPCVLSSGSDQIAALERLLVLSATMDIAAANMSLGGGEFFNQAACDAANGSLKAAIDNLRSVGIATVIAAGNDGYTNAIGSPGCISTAISVGATDDIDDVASFSNVYPELHVMAPGVAIDSSVPGGGEGSKQGTSMATPHVAGAFAVMKSRDSGLTVTEILADLTDTGTMVVDQRVGGVQEFPRINIDLAIGQPRTTFAIFNRGPGQLDVISIAPKGATPWVSANPSSFSLAKGALQVINVPVDFDTAPDGDSQAILTVTSNDSPVDVTVNIEALPAPGPEFTSDPIAGSTIDFGNVVVAQLSPGLTVNVGNIGSVNMNVSCSVSGTNQADFGVTSCPSFVSPGTDTDIFVTCTPGATGARSATLTISNNDGDENPALFPLSCTGVDEIIDEIFLDSFEGDPG